MSFAKGGIVWRFPVAVQILIAIIGETLLFFCPEFPKWLINRGRIQEAKEALAMIMGTNVEGSSILLLCEEIM